MFNEISAEWIFVLLLCDHFIKNSYYLLPLSHNKCHIYIEILYTKCINYYETEVKFLFPLSNNN